MILAKFQQKLLSDVSAPLLSTPLLCDKICRYGKQPYQTLTATQKAAILHTTCHPIIIITFIVPPTRGSGNTVITITAYFLRAAKPLTITTVFFFSYHWQPHSTLFKFSGESCLLERFLSGFNSLILYNPFSPSFFCPVLPFVKNKTLEQNQVGLYLNNYYSQRSDALDFDHYVQ